MVPISSLSATNGAAENVATPTLSLSYGFAFFVRDYTHLKRLVEEHGLYLFLQSMKSAQ